MITSISLIPQLAAPLVYPQPATPPEQKAVWYIFLVQNVDIYRSVTFYHLARDASLYYAAMMNNYQVHRVTRTIKLVFNTHLSHTQ